MLKRLLDCPQNQEWYIQILAYYHMTWPEFHMKLHDHPRVELMYVKTGACEVMTLDACHQLKKGDFVLIDADVPHTLEVRAGTPCRMMNIEFELVASIPESVGLIALRRLDPNFDRFLRGVQPVMTFEDNGAIEPLLRLIVDKLQRRLQGSYPLQLSLFQLFSEIARCAKPTLEPTAGRVVKMAIEHLTMHTDMPVRVSELSSLCGVHPNYLHRIFKQQVGETILVFAMKRKMDRACELLRMTDLPIPDISLMLAFETRQYFSGVFRKYTGMTPAAFRKKNMPWQMIDA